MIKVISISGRTGSGKQEVLRALHDRIPGAQVVMSDTTRDPRQSDIPNLRNHRLHCAYQHLRWTDPFLWSVRHDGADYGTSAIELERVFRKPNAVGLMSVVPDVVPELNRIVTGRAGGSDAHVAVYILSTNKKMTLRRQIHGHRVGLVAKDRRRDTTVEEAGWYKLARSNAPFMRALFVRNNVSPEHTAQVIIRRLGL